MKLLTFCTELKTVFVWKYREILQF